MLKFYLIRHGKTYGNTQGRYIGGRTEEPLFVEGIRELEKRTYPQVQAVYASPMKRCIQTAEILYPRQSIQIEEQLRECDFGDFENKNYKELEGNQAYQAWIDSNGELPFPNGEDKKTFRERCGEGFARCVEDAFARKVEQAAAIVHGGTIMSILYKFGNPPGEYFQWQIKNGEFYELIMEKKLWQKEKRISVVKKGILSKW